MFIQQIEFATPQFDLAIKLRELVLRKPLNLQFHVEDIKAEFDSYHLGYFDNPLNLIGVLVLKPISSVCMKMRQVAIHPDHQRKGIGRLLVKASEGLTKAEGYTIMELNARENAVDFYLNSGYYKVGKKFKEVGISHFKMQKTL